MLCLRLNWWLDSAWQGSMYTKAWTHGLGATACNLHGVLLGVMENGLECVNGCCILTLPQAKSYVMAEQG